MLGECSKTCGGGERTNLRDKKIRDRNGGTCSGTPTVTEMCSMDFCPGIRFVSYQCVLRKIIKSLKCYINDTIPFPFYMKSIANGINGKPASAQQRVEGV